MKRRACHQRGFTLVELVIVLMLMVTLMHVCVQTFTVTLETWGSQDAALGVREDLRQGLERMIRDLRQAKAISVADNAIRYTIRESGTDNHYIFYLYHASETWVPAYGQDVYQLRKATLTGDIDGTFTYGDGPIYVKQVKPPTTSNLSASGNVLTIDLTVSRYDETFHLLQQLRPRNL